MQYAANLIDDLLRVFYQVTAAHALGIVPQVMQGRKNVAHLLAEISSLLS